MNNSGSERWLQLVLSLPTRSKAARMRAWRALKALGCAVLRDGVYLLPASSGRGSVLQQCAARAVADGGRAQVLTLLAQDARQEASLRAAFDRSVAYGALLTEIEAAREALARPRGRVAAGRWRRLQREFAAISEIDYFPGSARAQVAEALAGLDGAVRARESPGEPVAVPGAVARVDPARYRGRIWATRRRPWVDRLASAWLIRRFIDPRARFRWLDGPGACPRNAVGFDFDGATFTHVGALVTFEVLLASFGLDTDRALVRVGRLVHHLDVGGIAVPEAAGVETLLAGARARCRCDDALLARAAKVFDLLLGGFRVRYAGSGEPVDGAAG